ncbi:MAG: NADH-quinone oxidoreductase subunit M [Acidobacteriaceae bacterium]|nr:NADH-quinone oxidoreductase subunit M [Acidobacteriaceae bacterium]MBV9781619.1 NADH-quinone oxidoreductase subunit M [Acidobacteriaceae bacterium]
MILVCLILLPLTGGIASLLAARWHRDASRWIAMAAVGIDLLLTVVLWSSAPQSRWLYECNQDWIPQFGIRFHLAVDGLSLILLALTFFLGLMSVLASWTEIQDRIGFFHFNLLWVLAGITGVFLSLDLFLFYLFWELMLVPMYFLIGIWGHERRIYAAIKFFLFTQLSGLLMLAAIITLAILHQRSSGVLSFDYDSLMNTPLSSGMARLLMLGFFAAFAVKLPAVPVHTWLPDAHTEAPTAGSVVLAGLLLKTGAYGLIRFVLPFFPTSSHELAPVMMTLGVVGVLYGAFMALTQPDLKRLVAYTSVSHMGFVLIGIFAGNDIALTGAFMTMISHGISTGALFILAGALQHRMHTRQIARMGGLWETMPALSGAGVFFVMASVGLPGLGDFIGEFLVLFGAYRASVPLTAIATLGIIAATLYGLKVTSQVFQGPNRHNWRLHDLFAREWVIIGSMMACLLWLGLYPQSFIRMFQTSTTASQTIASASISPDGASSR